MRRTVRKKKPPAARLIGYDYETTRIKAGTPEPLYITAYGQNPKLHYASRIDSMAHLQLILVNNFLVPEFEGCKFVAWNGNNFDAYFTAAAIVTHPDFVMRPYLTRSKSLRGVRIIRRCDIDNKKAKGWEFLDGIAMLGLVGVKLAKFLDTFAPHLPKLVDAVDFAVQEFDPSNVKHCDYAMRDSVGLEYAMNNAQGILLEEFDQPLAVTMGGACIRILKANMPADVVVRPLDDTLKSIVRSYVLRGGYCYCVRRYQGPVWKYDLNQAYAAAMREAQLPAGGSFYTRTGVNKYASVYIVKLEAWKPGNIVPFYCRTDDAKGRNRSVFETEHIRQTWLTSIEHRQLLAEGWRVRVIESYGWEETFNLREYVDKLERGRMAAEGGPAGPKGTIYKNVGNHSYGKMLEELEPVEYVLAADCPPGFQPTYSDGEFDPLDHIYERFLDDDEINPKDYHQPHIGAFITAHVRMVVRRAALLAPGAWLYADTDCVVFSSDVTGALDIDPKRYGAWKLEESGTEFQIIAKKVYSNVATGKSSAKGLHVREVTPDMFSEWYEGRPPVQHQVQRNNFLRVMQGDEMFRNQTRTGTRVLVGPTT